MDDLDEEELGGRYLRTESTRDTESLLSQLSKDRAERAASASDSSSTSKATPVFASNIAAMWTILKPVVGGYPSEEATWYEGKGPIIQATDRGVLTRFSSHSTSNLGRSRIF